MAISWQLHGNRMAKCMGEGMTNAWQLHGNCMATSWQLHGNSMATARQLHGNCMATARQQHGNRVFFGRFILMSCASRCRRPTWDRHRHRVAQGSLGPQTVGSHLGQQSEDTLDAHNGEDDREEEQRRTHWFLDALYGEDGRQEEQGRTHWCLDAQ